MTPFSAAIWRILELYCTEGVLFPLEKKGHNSTNECKLIITINHCVFYDDDADALLLKIFQKGNRPHSRSHGWALPWHHCIIFAWLKANFSSSSRSAQATSAWIFWASRIRKPHLPSNHKMCVCRKVNSFFNYNSKKYRARLCKVVLGGRWELWIRLRGSFGFFRRKISLKMMMLCFVFKKCSLLSSSLSTSRDCESFMPTLLRETQESTLTSEVCL